MAAKSRAHRRQSQDIARLQARVGLGAAFVNAHLAAANNAVDMRFGHAFEFAQQKIV